MSYTLARFLALILGGYALITGFVALVGVGLPRLGMAVSEAVVLAVMLAFPLYCALILWGFHERSLGRVIIVIGGGAVGSIGAAILLAPVAG